MVRSKLVESINFQELKAIDDSDTKENNYKAPLYEATVLGINTIISIGQIKNTFVSQNIVYYPIYLIKKNKVISQIGVYEMFQDTVPSLMDDEGDIDLERVPLPLLYSFVTKSLIQKAVFLPLATTQAQPGTVKKSILLKPSIRIPVPAKVDSDSETDDAADEEDLMAGIHALAIGYKAPPDVPLKRGNIPAQTLEQFESEIHSYRRIKDEPWIQSYYKNNNFKLVRNNGGGDCLFYTICQAVKSISPDSDISVIKLRRMLAEVVSEDQYLAYRGLYDSLAGSLKTLRDENKRINAESGELIQLQSQAQSITEKRKIKSSADVLYKRNESIKEECNVIKENLVFVNFMKGVKNIEQLRDVIGKGEGTSEYWADEWAISSLEIILNIKIVILSHRDYMDNGNKIFSEINVINCGVSLTKEQRNLIIQTRDKAPVGTGASAGVSAGVSASDKFDESYEFSPDHYVMVSHTGGHYELITYRDTAMLTFPEIPYCVKLQIITRCLQGRFLNGVYSYIPQFILFMQDIGMSEKISHRDLDASIVDLAVSANPLFNESIVLMHHGKSSDQLPGSAQGDKLSLNDRKGFLDLMNGGGGNRGNNNWRRKISNEWCVPFTLDGHRWLSVQHYYQANKFLKRSPEFYILFTMDANKKSKYFDETSILSRISHDVDLATVAGKKIPIITIDDKKVRLRPDDIVIDSDFFNGRHARVLEDATMAKFDQNEELAKLLLMTNNAKLLNYSHTKHPETSIHLMRVRSKLRTKKGGVNYAEALD